MVCVRLEASLPSSWPGDETPGGARALQAERSLLFLSHQIPHSRMPKQAYSRGVISLESNPNNSDHTSCMA